MRMLRNHHNPTWRTWTTMRNRCKRGQPGYESVAVCSRWDSFELFVTDMGERPSNIHSIDRINPEGNYEPGNCRWATPKEQASHMRKRRNKTSQYIGVSRIEKTGKWRAQMWNGERSCHIGCFDTEEEAAEAVTQFKATA